ncbi:hypothetical protein S40293_09892, partial [Stachybotrys chartarum IBT 40293]
MPEDEGKITGILQAIDAVLDRCEEIVRHTSRNILCWLKSTRPRSSYPKPFSLICHDSTTKKYRWVWKRALVFAIRLYLLTLYGQKGRISIDLNGPDGYGSEDDAAGDEYQKEDEDREGEKTEAEGSNDDEYTDDDNDEEDHTDDELNDSIQETACYDTVTSPESDRLLELVFALSV